MITTQFPLTLHLATAFGAYMLAAAISGWINRQRWLDILEDIKRSQALTFIAAIFTFAIGTAIVITHNYWTDPLSGTVSAIGWIAATKGLLFMINPRPSFALADTMISNRLLTPYFALVTLVGAALLFVGLTGQTP